MNKVYILLADGFEEIEFITPYDLLKRAGNKVFTLGIGGKTITGAHGLVCEADINIENVNDIPDCVVTPGGLLGSQNIAKSTHASEMIKSCAKKGKIVASICASPGIVLAPLGILENKSATCYPSFEEYFPASAKYIENPVVLDGNLITAAGPGCAYDFALEIIKKINNKEKSDEIAKETIYKA